jgi:hypothetical protein
MQAFIDFVLRVPAERQNLGVDLEVGICSLLGTIFTTFLFALYRNKFSAYRYIPVVCVVGFFSFLPGYLLLMLLVLFYYAIMHLTA